jgi:hypothetical protein
MRDERDRCVDEQAWWNALLLFDICGAATG